MLPVYAKRLVAHFGAAEDDLRFGGDLFENFDEVVDIGSVPDVDTDADDSGVFGKDLFGYGRRIAFDDILLYGRTGAELMQVGVEITQPERGMGVAGVDPHQYNLTHAVIS